MASTKGPGDITLPGSLFSETPGPTAYAEHSPRGNMVLWSGTILEFVFEFGFSPQLAGRADPARCEFSASSHKPPKDTSMEMW